MVKIVEKLLRAGEGRIVKKLENIADQVNAIEDDFVAMSDDELRGMTDEFRSRLADGETLDDIRPRGRSAHPGQAALRRAAHGRCRAPHGQRRRDEDR